MITDAKEKATPFNDYFSTQCKVKSVDTPLPNLIDFQNSQILSDISTSEREVNVLLNVDVSKACGIDDVRKNSNESNKVIL